MTQTFVDRYMEDDMIYKIIGFARDNVVYFVALFITGIATFFSGKLYGVKTHSVISGLKERYENIETQKKKLRKQISFLTYIDQLLKKSVILISLAQVGLIGNIIFHRGFDYTVFLVNSLSRNLILLLSIGLLVFLITQKGLRKFKTSKIQYLSTIHSGMDDIADKLLKSLGPELTTILKQKLQIRSVNTVSSGTQTIAKEPKEVKQKPEVVINPAELNELKKQIAALEAANQTKMGAIEYEEIAKAILKKDLFRHKVFIQKLKSFEWCENCLLHAEQDNEVEQEEEKIKEQVEQNEEGGAPEKTHPVNPENKDEIDAAKNTEEQKKEDVGNNGDQKGGEKCECVNECLKRYFEMGFEMSEQFNNEEKEILALKNKFGLIRRNSSA